MTKYTTLTTTLTMLSTQLQDSITISISVKDDFYWIGLESSRGKTIEKKVEVGALVSPDVMFDGELSPDRSITEDIVCALCDQEYIYDSFGVDRYEFKL